MSTDLELHAENVQAIHDFRIKFDRGPGAYQLTGKSGSGKSTLLDSAAAIIKGKGAKFPAGVSDGERRGKIEGLGVRITLTPGRSKRAGEAEVTSLEGRYDVSDFIHPGYKDEATNDAKRIKAIVNLTGVAPDLAQFRDLVPKGADLESVIEPETAKAADLIDMAAKIKRDFEKQARMHESQLEAKRQARLALLAACEGIDLDAEHDPKLLAANQEAAIKFRAELVAKDVEAEKAIEKATEAGRKLFTTKAERTGPTVEEAETTMKATDRHFEFAAKAVEEQDAIVTDLETKLGLARQALEMAKSVQDSWLEKVHAARSALNQARDYEQLLSDLERSSYTDATRIPEEEIVAAQNAVDAARAAVEQGAIVRQALEKRGQAAEEEKAIRSAEAKATEWRDAAAAVEEVLSNVVSEQAPCGISVKIEDGKPRLFFDYPGRGKIPFCELSEGEICKTALDIAIPAAGKGGFVVIDQEPWQGLQPANRRLMGERAAKEGVFLLTALVSDDEELHVEYMGN